jgi:hypothetical protein
MAFKFKRPPFDYLLGVAIFLLVIGLILLYASGAEAQSMRRDSIKAAVFDMVCIPTAGTDIVTSGRANRAIEQAIGDVCRDFPALIKYDTVTLTSTSDALSLNSDFLDAQGCFRMVGDSLRIPLKRTNYDSLVSIFTRKETALGKPDDIKQPRYFWITGSYINFYPKYSNSYDDNLYLIEYRALASAPVADTSQINIDILYRNELLYATAAKVSYLRKNYGESGQWLALYDRAALKQKQSEAIEK